MTTNKDDAILIAMIAYTKCPSKLYAYEQVEKMYGFDRVTIVDIVEEAIQKCAKSNEGTLNT